MTCRTSSLRWRPGAGGAPTCVLVAHGTRDPAGAATTHRLAERVRTGLPGVDVRVAFADVRRPDVTDVLLGCDRPAIVVPVFLAAGYHVRVDIPDQVRRADRPAVVTPHLGNDLVTVALQRLRQAGWRRGDTVLLAAAGSGDPRALRETELAAAALAEHVGAVHIGYATGDLPAVVARLPGRVAVASWFLAPGLFHRRAAGAGAAVVTEPLGAHPLVADLVIDRYTAARRAAPVAASDEGASPPRRQAG